MYLVLALLLTTYTHTHTQTDFRQYMHICPLTCIALHMSTSLHSIALLSMVLCSSVEVIHRMHQICVFMAQLLLSSLNGCVDEGLMFILSLASPQEWWNSACSASLMWVFTSPNGYCYWFHSLGFLFSSKAMPSWGQTYVFYDSSVGTIALQRMFVNMPIESSVWMVVCWWMA